MRLPGTYISPADTGFYYLQSRYYDPVVGRFINADAFASTGQGLLGYNMFAYCNNNPVNYQDSTGLLFSWLWDGISGVVDFALHVANSFVVENGIDTAEIGADLLDMNESSPGSGIYHASTDCWQQYFGYNGLYDVLFDCGTSMQPASFEFAHNGTSYVIWAWKGDYINLGAGAELGIYYGGGPHWLVDTSLSMPMTLTLGYNGSPIISHSQTTWWITGFNSNYLNVQANALTATFAIDFSSNPGMYNSFYAYNSSASGWVFDSKSYIATFTF